MDQYSRIKKQIEGLLKDSTFLISKVIVIDYLETISKGLQNAG